MTKYQIKIECISDCCVSDGSVYNSSIDIDVCYDKVGLPYIPAKRLKGILRESAIELNDWNDNIPINTIFGEQGDARGNLTISDAHVENYDHLKQYILKHQNNVLCHPQNILKTFTYIRTQTSIDYDTGIAQEGTLRTMRVINKGTIFYCTLDIDDIYLDSVKKCLAMTTNIGVSRTRGLGEIRMEISNKIKEENTSRHFNLKGNENTIAYHFNLKHPVICKSISGETHTMDYIEGSKMLGLLVQCAKDKNIPLSELFNDELFVSNAYIEHKNIRALEIPATYYTFKNDPNSYFSQEKESNYLIKDKQVSQIKHGYCVENNEGLTKVSVDTERRYHHSRPEDKSIGRAIENKENADSLFYQLESISENQCFGGYITGSFKQIECITQLLSDIYTCHIGNSRYGEYGLTNLYIDTPFEKKEMTIKSNKFAVKLESPAIIYNDYAYYSTNSDDLIDEIIRQIPELATNNIKKYIKYSVSGGYNVTWQFRKPTMSIFDKGTVLLFTFDEEKEITIPSMCYLGERIQEGFGEFSIKAIDNTENKPNTILKAEDDEKSDTINIKECASLMKVADRLLSVYLEGKAIEFSKENANRKQRSTVSNLSLMCNEFNSFNNVKYTADKRFNEKTVEKKEEKAKYANLIFTTIEDNIIPIINEFKKSYKINNYNVDIEKQKIEFLRIYLRELKYQIRSKGE